MTAVRVAVIPIRTTQEIQVACLHKELAKTGDDSYIHFLGWGAFCLCLMAKTVIAIDGPAASGKSTTAKLVAQKLGFLYLDTGAMYRAITLNALENGVDVNDEENLEKLTEDSTISFRMLDGINRILLDGRDVSDKIREPSVNQSVSYVSMHKKVRRLLVQMQKKMGQESDLVAEGRDTTTVVFPHAFKVYLDADLKERARRRLLELEQKGIETTMEDQIQELSRRDKLDSGRKVSPLLRHKDAVIVDTTDLTVEQQVDRVIQLFGEWKRSQASSQG
jgi:cytidylate kinase